MCRGYINLANKRPCEEGYWCWTAIPEISVNNVDVALMIVTISNVRYYQPVADPLFAAHTLYNLTTGT